MKKKFFNRVALLCAIVAATMFAPSDSVFAGSNGSSLYDDVTQVTDKTTVLTRGNFLAYGAVTMNKVSSTRLELVGETQAYQICDKLYVDLYLERSTDGGETFKAYREFNFEEANDSHLSGDIILIVPSNCYYRLSGRHTAVVGQDGEFVTTQTEALHLY